MILPGLHTVETRFDAGQQEASGGVNHVRGIANHPGPVLEDPAPDDEYMAVVASLESDAIVADNQGFYVTENDAGGIDL